MKNGDYILVIAPDDYPGKRYRGRYCYEHYLVYWRTHGVLPKPNETIHHKNENKHDNSPDNLELRTRGNHTAMHGRERGITMVELRCPTCGKLFTRQKRQTHFATSRSNRTFCCRKCAGKFNHLPKQKQIEGTEQMFVREFKQFPDDIGT